MSGDTIVIILLLTIYFVPAIVATIRRHSNEMAISMLNLLLGWTLIGWIGALIWACTDNVRPRNSTVPKSRSWSAVVVIVAAVVVVAFGRDILHSMGIYW